jgi:hypothetical protein
MNHRSGLSLPHRGSGEGTSGVAVARRLTGSNLLLLLLFEKAGYWNSASLELWILERRHGRVG